jgi:hypothetical protein
MADMDVDTPAGGSEVAAGKKKKQEGPRFEVKRVGTIFMQAPTFRSSCAK